MQLVLLRTVLVWIDYDSYYSLFLAQTRAGEEREKAEWAGIGINRKSICKSMEIGFHFLPCVGKKKKKKHSRWA